MADFHVLRIDSLLKSLTLCNAGKEFLFQLDITSEISAQPGDYVLGYISAPIDEVRYIFQVKSSSNTSLVLTKELEVAKGVTCDFSCIAELQPTAYTKDFFTISYDLYLEITSKLSLVTIKHKTFLPSDVPIQAIYYGAPGTGKSYKVKHEVIPSGVKHYTVTFYSDYYYSDFVGGIRPTRTTSGIEYKFQPGPFAKALKDSFAEPVYLVIEEINRGNAAAIFGDIFQLLDRKSGTSEYSITNHDLYEYLIEEGVTALPEVDKIYLPSNLNIVGTMNTADQNVFVLDTAFKRRFKMKYVPIDFNAYYKNGVLQEGCKGYIEKSDIFTDESFETDLEKIIPAHIYKQIKDKVKEIGRNWPTFAAYVNAIIDEINSSEQKISEDKKLGPFFVDIDELDDIRSFVDKVIYYLKQDVFKYEDNILDESYETLYSKIVNRKYDLFRLFDSK